MNHLKWMGHSATIFDIQRNLRNDPQSCEVTLVAKGHSVRAHRFVLSSCSDLLRNLLVDVPMGQEATIVVPDIKGSLLDSVLAFIYMGETSLTSTNLSEFLEAINTLGIKSAISFECNNAATITGSGSAAIKTLSGIQIGQEELMEQENVTEQKLESQNVIAEPQERELEFLDVYSEAQHSKITYSIEHMSGTNAANEYILTENSGTYTLTENNKLESTSNSDSEKIEDLEDTTADAHIIEEYSSSADPIIEIAHNTPGVHTPTPITIQNTPVSRPLIQIKSRKIKAVKLKVETSANEEQLQESIDATLDSNTDPISVLKMPNDTYSPPLNITPSNQEDSLYLAVQAVINEGMSLQKSAQKFDISKTVLWRRVRKHPNYMKTTRENPVLAVAYERLKCGDSLKNISRELDIPMSTLHRHKVRLAQQGRLPDYISFKKRDVNSKIELKDKLTKALHACVHEGMSQNHAANLFDIPKSTLWRHLQKRVAEAELLQKLEQEDIKEEVILS